MHSNAVSSSGRQWLALSGVLFVAFFLAGDLVRPVLATAPLPMPGAPPADVVRYYESSGTGALAVNFLQALSALSLFIFAGCVSQAVGRAQGAASRLPLVARVAGVLAAAFLLACALLGLALAPAAAGGDLALVGRLRSLNFLAGGTFHVAALGIFAGAAALAARRSGALPRWLVWWGVVEAVVSVLSLASLVLYPAALLILLGRLLGFVWSIAVGLLLAFGRRRGPVVEQAHLVRS